MKINTHKDTRVIKLHFRLADDAMFYIIWFIYLFIWLFLLSFPKHTKCITHYSLTHGLLVVSFSSSSSFAASSKL